MVFIESVELTNFKSYHHSREIGPFLQTNAVVGPNGTGKSNMLDAIQQCEEYRKTYEKLVTNLKAHQIFAQQTCTKLHRLCVAHGKPKDIEDDLQKSYLNILYILTTSILGRCKNRWFPFTNDDVVEQARQERESSPFIDDYSDIECLTSPKALSSQEASSLSQKASSGTPKATKNKVSIFRSQFDNGICRHCRKAVSHKKIIFSNNFEFIWT
uniref:RecF/RecN/SMC N-terminal domain-containing protein n=1 Tax=Panagrolaimus davidi TaxID=227884 RepID=A0A914QXW7_9BILA